MISKKGFTLFEILIVITIMAIISIAAFTSTVNTQKQFVFINNSKELLMKIREARLYNVTQKSVEVNGAQVVPPAYGISIKKVGNNIETTAFADLATGTQNQFDKGSDPVIGHPFSFDSTKYTLSLIDNNNDTPITTFSSVADEYLNLLYQPGELNVTTFYHDGTTPRMITDSYIHLEFKDANIETLKKNIIIFTQSGIAEEIKDLTALSSMPTPQPQNE